MSKDIARIIIFTFTENCIQKSDEKYVSCIACSVEIFKKWNEESLFIEAAGKTERKVRESLL